MPQHEDTKWNLPPQLQINSPEALEKAEAFQKQLAQKANSPFAHLSPREQEQVNAARMIDHLSADLHRIDEELGKQDSEELREGRYALAARLAEAYATLGRFELAADADPREDHKAEHLEIIKAINRDNAEWCECAPGRSYIKKDLPQGFLIACSGCKTMNVVPTIPENLAEQRALRAKAQSLVKDMSPEDAAKTLRAAGHTSKLLKL